MKKEDKDRRSGKGCWYKIYLTECVLCGAGTETRERRYDPPPEKRGDRYEYDPYVCDDHFL